MNAKRIDEFRRMLREGHPVRVVNGQVVLEDQPAATSAPPERAPDSPPHRRAGQVPRPAGVQVKPHEWGAVDAAPALYETAGGQRRALTEQALLRREYPGFVMDIDAHGTLYAHGHIGPTGTLRHRYHVLVLLPPGYGQGVVPQVHVLEPELKPNAPHRFSDGALCLDHSDAFTKRSTVITILAWVSVWLELYEDWAATGRGW